MTIFSITSSYLDKSSKIFTHTVTLEADTLQEAIKKAHREVFSDSLIPKPDKTASLIHISIAVIGLRR